MSGSITINPYATSQPASTFLADTQGYVQGVTLDDPTSRMWLMGGTLATSESLPMWGGVPVSEYVNLIGAGSEGLGPTLKRATAAPGSASGVSGFSVFNQASSMVISPGNSVPLAAVGNYVSFLRLGTQARVPVQCDPALLTTLSGTNVPIDDVALYWSTTYYYVTLTTTSNFALTGVRLLSINTNSKIVSYSSSVATWTTGTAAIILI